MLPKLLLFHLSLGHELDVPLQGHPYLPALFTLPLLSVVRFLL